MQQPSQILANGTMVRTSGRLDSTAGMSVEPEYLKTRRSNALGKISGVVGGHGGDVYWVTHAGGAIAAYCFSEFELAAVWESLPEEAPKESGNLWTALQEDEL
jgi:hypothetical protein